MTAESEPVPGQLSQTERATLENDRRLREQGSTFSQFAESEVSEPRGRFSERERADLIEHKAP